MNVVLLITVLVLVVGANSAYNPSPCMDNDEPDAYGEFVHRHVLQEEFDTTSRAKWRSYLTKYKFCGRRRQSFIDKGAEHLYIRICNGSGKRQGRSNLCTSTYPVRVHDLAVTKRDWSCTVDELRSEYRYVTVNCDKVIGQCLPVNFNSSQIYMPDDGDETCKP